MVQQDQYGHGWTGATGVFNVPSGAQICLCTFDFWQDTQERIQAVISRRIFSQQNLAEISFTVALGPGYAKKQPYNESLEQEVEVRLLRFHR